MLTCLALGTLGQIGICLETKKEFEVQKTIELNEQSLSEFVIGACFFLSYIKAMAKIAESGSIDSMITALPRSLTLTLLAIREAPLLSAK